MWRPSVGSSLLFTLAALVLPTLAHAGGHDDFQLVEATIADIQEQYRSGDLSPEDVVRMYQARIEAYDRAGPHLNSFMHVNQRAIADARALAGGELGDDDGSGDQDETGKPLFGIPVILKDNIATTDMPTTAGSIALGRSFPSRDAFIYQKLRRAGAIIIGKGTLTEFANFIGLGMPTGYSSQLRFQLFQGGGDLARVGYGFNPFDPRTDPRTKFNDGRPALITGGSSSGPGIAVSANLATVGVGTETSGSILSPSSQNMLVGIKPTVGLISRTGIVPITADQDTAGPMARTVTDAAKLLGVLAGYDPEDPATAACLEPGKCLRDYTRFLKEDALEGARIAVPKMGYWKNDDGTVFLSVEQEKVMNDAIAVLRKQGAVVEEFDVPDRKELFAFGTCVVLPIPTNCSTVLIYGFKRDLNGYLSAFGPGMPVEGAPVRTLADVIHFNEGFAIGATKVGLKYGQAIALAADSLDIRPGSADTARYLSDRKKDLDLSRTRGLDVIYKKYDAVLFPANFGANIAARAGYPSIVVPGGFVVNPAASQSPSDTKPTPFPPLFGAKPAPFGVTFSGPAFSEGKLLGYAYAFEQETQHRVAPPSTPAIPAEASHGE
ncbi:MAG: amidase family protein [Myxococcales bacterium]